MTARLLSNCDGPDQFSMMAVIFDEAATEFGHNHHPERAARLINTEAYLLDKHPEWVWINPRLATETEVLRAHHSNLLERLRKPVDFDADTRITRELKNTLDAPLERQSVPLTWRSPVEKDFPCFVRPDIMPLPLRPWVSAI